MKTLDQPPPDLPAPPPGPEALRSQGKMNLICWLGGLSIFVLLCLLSRRVILRSTTADDRTEALNNIRQIGLALFEFEADYGRFPSAATIPDVKLRTSTPLTLDDSNSNRLFRQLIADGRNEKPFWCKTKTTPKKPDDVFRSDSTALQPGECGFAYIAGLKLSDGPETPVVMAPLEKGKTTFDPKPFKGWAVILFLDNSAKSLPIEKDGRVLINGMDIFDPRQPFWKGKAPDIKWQE